MEFFPEFIQRRNKLRGTPHFSLLLAVAIPISVLLVARGAITVLGDLYAFGLLGAFALTCVGLDIVRRRERKAAYVARAASRSVTRSLPWNDASFPTSEVSTGPTIAQASALVYQETDARKASANGPDSSLYTGRRVLSPWQTCKFYLGLLTTALVILAWTTNLIAKPMATIFGGSVTLLGMGIAFFNYIRQKRQGHVSVPITHAEEHLPGSTLAVLMSDETLNEAVIHTALQNAHGQPVTFLYLSHTQTSSVPRWFELHDPYYDDQAARHTFSRAEHLAQKAKIARRFVYRQQEPSTLEHIWQAIHPHDLIISSENRSLIEEINPDRIRYEVTSDGRVAHLLKSW